MDASLGSLREHLLEGFCPAVLVLSTEGADEIVFKNDLTFAQLLRPFGTLDTQRLSWESHIHTHTHTHHVVTCTHARGCFAVVAFLCCILVWVCLWFRECGCVRTCFEDACGGAHGGLGVKASVSCMGWWVQFGGWYEQLGCLLALALCLFWDLSLLLCPCAASCRAGCPT